MFDFTGCFLNLIQMQIDSSRAGYGFLLFDKRLNLGKFLLTVISGCSDIVLLIQYYVVYPYASAQLDQSQSFITLRSPLIASEKKIQETWAE